MRGIATIFTLIITSIALAIEKNEKITTSCLLEHKSVNRQQPLPEEPIQSNTYVALVDALDVLQTDYFKIWPGVWPKAIDWTAAVIGTGLAGSLRTFSSSLSVASSQAIAANVINRYFSQLSASFFGQDIFAIRQEANDDMLWVVLEWIEGTRFINERSLSYTPGPIGGTWYGQQWIPDFAHRARVFWDVASRGWNTTLCDGGMIWNPRLLPYKNAITNELYISASVAMYLYFPGDNNDSPFQKVSSDTSIINSVRVPRNVEYLDAAIEAYKWLYSSNMTNSQGLFVDGYHISGWNSGFSNNTKCDERNEMVYTYNQGVLLSGHYGLYQATGIRSYLEDGHRLVINVIKATGWDFNSTNSTAPENGSPQLGKWYGLGRNGILEEACDASATCSQDSQTFKGIFFYHLTTFCSQLVDPVTEPEGTTRDSPEEIRKWHYNNCQRYGPWIKYNADAALNTLDSRGRFGGWWGATSKSTANPGVDYFETPILPGAVDYRNSGVPQEWMLNNKSRIQWSQRSSITSNHENIVRQTQDPNERGRGRTVETQLGGLNVLRALWEIVERPQTV